MKQDMALSEEACLEAVFAALAGFRRRFTTNTEAAARLRVSNANFTKWMIDRNEYVGGRTKLRNPTLRQFSRFGDGELRDAAKALLAFRRAAEASADTPAKVRWGPSDGMAAGIRVSSDDQDRVRFIPWRRLAAELHSKLLPQLFADPSGYDLVTADHHGKKDWLVYVVDGSQQKLCYVWFGGDPQRGWQWDGLIRIGRGPNEIWQRYQRRSDGTYRRLPSKYMTLERALQHSPHEFPARSHGRGRKRA